MRGEGRRALQSVFDQGVQAICVLADRLFNASLTSPYRDAIMTGKLVLVSTASPDVALTGREWHARARAAAGIVHALADSVLVVHFGDRDRTVTADVVRQIESKDGRPVFVRTGAGIPQGNTELLRKGAKPFPADALTVSLKDALIATIAMRAEASPAPSQDEVVAGDELPAIAETPATYPEPTVEADATRMAVREAPVVLAPSVYEAVKPLILNALDKPRKLDELGKSLKVREGQLLDWVKLLLKDGVIEKRTIRKTKKFAIRKPDEELKLL